MLFHFQGGMLFASKIQEDFLMSLGSLANSVTSIIWKLTIWIQWHGFGHSYVWVRSI